MINKKRILLLYNGLVKINNKEKILHNTLVLSVSSEQNKMTPTPLIFNNDAHQMSDISRKKKSFSNLTSNDFYKVHCTTGEVITIFVGKKLGSNNNFK